MPLALAPAAARTTSCPRRWLRDLERLVERDHGFRPYFNYYDATSGVCAACRQAGAARR